MSYPGSFGLLLIRAVVGFVMVFHGAQKIFPQKYLNFFGGGGMDGWIESVRGLNLPGGIPAEYLAWTAALSEFAGGILLIIGLGTRIAALFIAGTMLVAAIKVHGHAFSLAEKGMEYALTLGLVALGLVFTGPGRYAIDSVFRRSPAPMRPPAKAPEKKR